MRFVADVFNVYSSRSSTGGGQYVTEAIYPFQQSASAERARISA